MKNPYHHIGKRLNKTMQAMNLNKKPETSTVFYSSELRSYRYIKQKYGGDAFFEERRMLASKGGRFHVRAMQSLKIGSIASKVFFL